MTVVPLRTANEIAEARAHLLNASRELAAAARRIKMHSHDSSVLASHIQQQVDALTDKVDDLLDGLEVVE